MAEENTTPTDASKEERVVGEIYIAFENGSTNIIGQRFEHVDMGQLIIAERVLKDMVDQQFVQARIAMMHKEDISRAHGPGPVVPVRRTLREIGKIDA